MPGGVAGISTAGAGVGPPELDVLFAKVYRADGDIV